MKRRLAPATFTVVNVNVAGPGSLRRAIDDFNLLPRADTINFAPSAYGTIVSTSETFKLYRPFGDGLIDNVDFIAFRQRLGMAP